MNKTLVAVLGSIGVLVIVILLIGGMWVSASNQEVRLRNAIVAKQTDNKNEMDAMWKNISQTAQVADKDRGTLIKLMNDYALARSGSGDNNSIFKWINEAVPNVDTKTFQNLQNIIVSQRDGFKFRQKELLDLNREHDNLIDTFPSSLFVGSRGKITVVIVTSDRTDNAFQTGKDNDVNLFNTNN